MDDELLTPKELGAELKLDTKTLRRWRYERKGPAFIPINRQVVRYRRSDVNAWIKAQNTARSA